MPEVPVADSGDTAWILCATALVLFMTIPGLSLFYGGLVRTKNVLSVLMQCFAITCAMTICWLAYAYSLTFDTAGMEAGVVGLRYTSPGDRYGAALHLTGVQRKRRIAPIGGAEPFATPGYATVDLTGYWNLTPNARITAGIFNLFDRKYWLWSDVAAGALEGGSAAVDRYTQPGINARVSLQRNLGDVRQSKVPHLRGEARVIESIAEAQISKAVRLRGRARL